MSNSVDSKSRMCRGNFPVPSNFPLVLCIFTSDDSNSDDSKSRITRVCLEVPRKGKQCNFTSMCQVRSDFFPENFELTVFVLMCQNKKKTEVKTINENKVLTLFNFPFIHPFLIHK